MCELCIRCFPAPVASAKQSSSGPVKSQLSAPRSPLSLCSALLVQVCTQENGKLGHIINGLSKKLQQEKARAEDVTTRNAALEMEVQSLKQSLAAMQRSPTGPKEQPPPSQRAPDAKAKGSSQVL